MKTLITTLKQLPKQSQRASDTSGAQPARRQRTPLPDETTSTSNTALNAQIEELAQARAEEIIAQQQQALILSNSGKTFSVFNPVEDIVDKQTEVVTAGLWSDNQGTFPPLANNSLPFKVNIASTVTELLFKYPIFFYL